MPESIGGKKRLLDMQTCFCSFLFTRINSPLYATKRTRITEIMMEECTIKDEKQKVL
jgi:hypothetical protein